MFGNKKPNYPKLRTNLRLCINRLKLMEKKKTELALKARKEIADYISGGKDDRARIRVEHIVREDYLVEAMEIVEMMCDLLLARFGLIDKMKELDAGLEETIATLIWTSPRMFSDIPELREVSNQLTLKYGKEFAEACRTNQFANVNEKVIHRMNVAAPAKHLVEQYMVEIAKTYNVPFEPDTFLLEGGVPNTCDLSDLIDLGGPKGPGAGDGKGSGGGTGGGGGGGGGGMAIPPLQPIGFHPGGQYPTGADDVPPGYFPGPPPSHVPPVNGATGEKPGLPVDNPVVPGYSGPHPGLPQPGIGGPPPLPHHPPHGYPAGAVNPGGHLPPNYPSLPAYDDVFGSQPANQASGAGTHPSAPDPSPPRPIQGNPADGSGGGLPDQPALLDKFPDVLGLPSVPTGDVGAESAGGDDINFDDLTKRFENLKKKK